MPEQFNEAHHTFPHPFRFIWLLQINIYQSEWANASLGLIIPGALGSDGAGGVLAQDVLQGSMDQSSGTRHEEERHQSLSLTARAPECLRNQSHDVADLQRTTHVKYLERNMTFFFKEPQFKPEGLQTRLVRGLNKPSSEAKQMPLRLPNRLARAFLSVFFCICGGRGTHTHTHMGLVLVPALENQAKPLRPATA
ncbi:unnamed protein product [Leuciscus chuanchicus]